MAQGNAHSNPFVIAALGASAGGLEAFEQYFKHVPSGARHRLRHHPALGPHHASAVPEFRAGCTFEKVLAPFKRIQAASIPAVSAWRFAKNGLSVRRPNLRGISIWLEIDVPLLRSLRRR
jgi:hypothetical protein